MWETSRKRWILFSGLTSFFLSIAMLYQMSPFFQKFALENAGATTATVGCVFAVLPTSAFLFSVPAGKFVAYCGPRVALPCSLLVLALSSILFGLSDSVLWWSIWRAVQGAASAPIYCSVAVMFASEFPDPLEFAKVNGYQEAMANIGFAVGPAVGGCLFQWGGFSAPFTVSAIFHLLFVFLSLCTPGDAKQGSEDVESKNQPLLDKVEVEHANVVDVLSADILMILPAGAIVPAIFGALDPVLATHFQACLGDLSSRTTGILISIPAIPAVGCALVVPWLMEKFGSYPVLASAMGIMAFVIMALGMSDPDSGQSVGFGLPIAEGSLDQWALQVLLALILGVSAALGWGPLLPEMMNKAAGTIGVRRNIGREDAMKVVSPAVSSLFNASAFVGEALGPIVGGALMTAFGFCGTFVLLGIVIGVYFVALVLCQRSYKEGRIGLPGRRISSVTRLRSSISIGEEVVTLVKSQ